LGVANKQTKESNAVVRQIKHLIKIKANVINFVYEATVRLYIIHFTCVVAMDTLPRAQNPLMAGLETHIHSSPLNFPLSIIPTLNQHYETIFICWSKPMNVTSKPINIVLICRLIDEHNFNEFKSSYSSVPMNVTKYSSVT
jgi:hypothetical protein